MSRERTDFSLISRKGNTLKTFIYLCVQESSFFHRIVIHSTTPNEENAESELRRVSVTQNSTDSSLLSPEAAMSQQDNQNQEDSTISAVTLVRDVLYGNRDNVNFVHELYRQAFLLDFSHAGAIRKAIAVYKDWIQMNVSLKLSQSYLSRVDIRESCFYIFICFAGNSSVYVGTIGWS